MHAVTQLFSRVKGFLDERGPMAWLAAMILGFIFIWPLGLALLFYMIWSNRMCRSSHHADRAFRHAFHRGSSGNTVFDTYRDETLKRLEDEQSAFHSFMQRLRTAKDQSEFDMFMNQRRDDVTRSSDRPDDLSNAQPA